MHLEWFWSSNGIYSNFNKTPNTNSSITFKFSFSASYILLSYSHGKARGNYPSVIHIKKSCEKILSANSLSFVVIFRPAYLIIYLSQKMSLQMQLRKYDHRDNLREIWILFYQKSCSDLYVTILSHIIILE